MDPASADPPETVTTAEDDDDDDFVPPTAVHVESRVQICPVCHKPFKRHSAMQLLECSEGGDIEEEEDSRPKASAPVDHEDEDDDGQRCRFERFSRVDREPIGPVSLQRRPVPNVAAPAAVADDDQPPSSTKIIIPDGEIDYEQLAAGLRTVIEKERDEIVRRGGPLEKQNAELKERLYDALKDAGMWRDRFQGKCRTYNLLEEQNRELVKTNRKLKQELAGRKNSGDAVRILELPGLIRAAERASKAGWEVRRLGNGHYGFYLHNQWITDAATSGQGNKVNMATRNKLKKAGLPV